MNIKIGEIIKKLRRERDVTQEKHASANDAIPAEPAHYTSVFVNKMTHSTANTIKSTTETTREQFLKKLSDKNFAILAEEPGFAALNQRFGQ